VARKEAKDTYDYNNDFNKNNYDRISLMLPKGSKAILKDVAASEGIKVNALIRRAIDRELERLAADPLPDRS
jgi:hypothetical protein